MQAEVEPEEHADRPRRDLSAHFDAVGGGAFEPLEHVPPAAAGLFGRFIAHQRLVHTFETNVRGPAHRLRVAGHEVSALLPVAVNPGNVGAAFAVLSYAGELAVTVVTDPDLVPDDEALVALLAAELGAFSQVSV